MKGSERLLQAASTAGVKICFLNPGTTELPLIAGLEVANIRAVLGLSEGVTAGAADGYFRMGRNAPITITHLGPGFANGISNLHNARRARSGIVNLVGDHPTWHRSYDPILASDIAALTATCSDWTRTVEDSQSIVKDITDAVSEASSIHGQVVSLVIPADIQWSSCNATAEEVTITPPGKPDEERIKSCARELCGERRVALLVGGAGLSHKGMFATSRISAKSNCRVFSESFPARIDRDPSFMSIERLPYMPTFAKTVFKDIDCVILVGIEEPVAFFAEEDLLSKVIPENVNVKLLAEPTEDIVSALERLAEELGATQSFNHRHEEASNISNKILSPLSVCSAVANMQPENAIIIDEGISAAGIHLKAAENSAPHSYLSLTGGACGQGMPCAIGAAIACPDRKVIVIEGDGSGLFTVQALWTQARESLDIVNVILNNKSYRILKMELKRRYGAKNVKQILPLTDLNEPEINWVELSKSFGVPAESVSTIEELNNSLRKSIGKKGPSLIEVKMR